MAEKADKEASYWQNQIVKAEKDNRYRRWQNVGQQFYDRYLLESQGMAMNSSVAGDGQFGPMVYNLFWSNVQTLLPMLYSQLPEPYIARRYGNRDPVARMAATIAERATMTDLELDDFDDQATSVALDFAVVGRGVLRGIYESTVVNSRIPVSQEEADDGAPRFVTEARDEIPQDLVENDRQGMFVLDPKVKDERAPLQYHNWKDFLIGPGRKWKEVQKHGWIDWITYLTKADATKRFGKAKANGLNYDVNPFEPVSNKHNQSQSTKSAPSTGAGMLARIDETWDARSRQIFWTSPGSVELLDKEPDFLDLIGFFNTPRPLLATTGNDSMVPVPDYAEYRPQAKEMDEATAKIEQIMEEIRGGGVYNAAVPGLGTALRNKVGGWHSVDNWEAFASSGGMVGSVQGYNIKELIEAVISLYQHRQNVKRDADELAGMPDIFRAQQAEKDERLGQTEIRKQMGGLRINDKQRDFQRYLRDALAIKAEIIVSQFDDQRILEMADFEALMDESPELTRIKVGLETPQGQQALQDPQQAVQIVQALQQATQRQQTLIRSGLALLKDDRMRTFKLDIETDATVAIDEAVEKRDAAEFVKVVTDFMSGIFASDAVKSSPDLQGLAGEMLMFVVRRFKVGRSLEQKIEGAVKNIATAPPAQPPPDPLTMDVQRQAKADEQDFQIDQTKNKIDEFEAVTDREKAKAQALAAAKDSTREDLKLVDELLENDEGISGNA